MKSNKIAKVILLLILAFRGVSLLLLSGEMSPVNIAGGILYIVAAIGIVINKKWGVILAVGVVILHAIFSWIEGASPVQITQTIVDLLILALAYATYKGISTQSNTLTTNTQV